MKITISKDLRSKFNAARDQGQRPTCLAFATSDCHSVARDALDLLSPEYLFYHAQQRARLPATEGATVQAILEALETDGQPLENEWPYLSAIPSDLKKWSPPQGIGSIFRRCSAPHPASFDEIVATLNAGKPVLVILKLCDGFYRPDISGYINHAGKPDDRRLHAVIAAAHGRAGGEAVILVRNSWGSSWGDQGYAWLTRSYIVPRLLDAIILSEEPNVPAN